jgi:hypothetical protein
MLERFPTAPESAPFHKMAYARIPRAQQRKVREFTEKFQANPKSPGINYEKIHDVQDDKVRTVGLGWRCAPGNLWSQGNPEPLRDCHPRPVQYATLYTPLFVLFASLQAPTQVAGSPRVMCS